MEPQLHADWLAVARWSPWQPPPGSMETGDRSRHGWNAAGKAAPGETARTGPARPAARLPDTWAGGRGESRLPPRRPPPPHPRAASPPEPA